LELPKTNVHWFIFFVLTFPTSFFFISLYTESLYLLFFIGSLLSTRNKSYLIAFICALAIGLTRVTGIFLIIPLFFELLQTQDKKRDNTPIWKQIIDVFKSWKNILVLLAPIIGLGIYSIYLKITTNDFFAFFNLQPISNATRSTELILLPQVLYRYLKIFLTATLNFQYFIAGVEFVTILFVGSLIMYDFWRIISGSQKNAYTLIGLHLNSLAILILPTLTGTLSSLPRYAVPLLSTYYILATIKNTWIKVLIGLVFVILHVILFSYFIQGYFVS